MVRSTLSLAWVYRYRDKKLPGSPGRSFSAALGDAAWGSDESRDQPGSSSLGSSPETMQFMLNSISILQNLAFSSFRRRFHSVFVFSEVIRSARQLAHVISHEFFACGGRRCTDFSTLHILQKLSMPRTEGSAWFKVGRANGIGDT